MSTKLISVEEAKGRGKGKSGGKGLLSKRGIITAQLILLAYALIIVTPILWLIFSSLKSDLEIFASPWQWPKQMQWGNYFRAWQKANMGRYLFNSVIVSSSSLVLLMMLASMASYALARIPFQGAGLLLMFFVSGMMIPVFLGLIPLFEQLQALGLLDSHIGLISVYIAQSLPFTIFLLTGFFKTMPKELEEAATIDGCSPYGTFFRVMLPVARTGLITAGTINFVNIWNEYILALTFITQDALRTLPVGLANLAITQTYETDWGALFAGMVIVLVPTVIVYLLFQSQLTEGMTMGAVKG